MYSYLNRIYHTLWLWSFSFAAHLARVEKLAFLSNMLMRFFAWQSLLIKGGKRKDSLQEVILEWQRMFPSRDFNVIKAIEDNTAYAEVHVQCPLRGSGNVLACYRLMEYDRAMLRKIGGQLVVLRSQAEPGIQVCSVALRMSAISTDDLNPAHKAQRL